jgi:hypothetical protein
MQRRTLFKLGIASATVLVLAGGAAALIEPGLAGSRLSASGREVFNAVGRAVLDKSIPVDEGARQIALNGLLTRIDTLVAGLPPHAQAELSQLLSLLATAGGRRALAGLSQPWADASVTEIQQALQGMRLSSLALRQQAYGALHDITAGAYFADDATWALVGYPGPLKI